MLADVSARIMKFYLLFKANDCGYLAQARCVALSRRCSCPSLGMGGKRTTSATSLSAASTWRR
eukprot:10764119-Alexandrium_andersonii.AAC.1